MRGEHEGEEQSGGEHGFNYDQPPDPQGGRLQAVPAGHRDEAELPAPPLRQPDQDRGIDGDAGRELGGRLLLGHRGDGVAGRAGQGKEDR
jgi:hypothetical protein